MTKVKKVSLKSILNEIILNGGVSYNITTQEVNPQTGYMVGILGFEEKFDVTKITDQDIKDYIFKNAGEFWGTTRYIGGFLKNNFVYLDISVNIDDLTRACYTGIINKQNYIYDCSNKRTISLPTPQTSGTDKQQKEYNLMKAKQLAYLIETTGVE